MREGRSIPREIPPKRKIDIKGGGRFKQEGERERKTGRGGGGKGRWEGRGRGGGRRVGEKIKREKKVQSATSRYKSSSQPSYNI